MRADWPSSLPNCLYLAVAECADGPVDWEGCSSRGKDSNSGLLYRQRGTIGVDKREGPVCGLGHGRCEGEIARSDPH